MSSLYEQLTREKKKFDKNAPIFQAAVPVSDSQKFQGLLSVKIGSIIAFILSLVALTSAVYLYQSLNGERRQREALEASMIQIQENTESLRSESALHQSEAERLRTQLVESAKAHAELKRQVEQAQTQITALQQDNKDLEAQNKKLDEELKAQASSLASQQSDPTGLSGAKLTQVLASGATQSAAAPLLSSVVSQSPVSIPSKPQKIMTINRKFNFVVLNLGIRDGIKMGDKLVVQHDGKTTANLQVDKLYEDFAAATIFDEDKKDPLKEGDTVLKA